MREIIKEPNNLLHKPCEPVDNFKEAERIANELLVVIKSVTRWWKLWLGFAANQIGYPKRIIILRKDQNEYEILVNPIIVKKRFPFPFIETCYSFDVKKYYLVKRYLWVKVKYQNLEGDWCKMILKGPSAVYQEMDHIDRIMVSEIGWRIL